MSSLDPLLEEIRATLCDETDVNFMDWDELRDTVLTFSRTFETLDRGIQLGITPPTDWK